MNIGRLSANESQVLRLSPAHMVEYRWMPAYAARVIT